MEAAEVREQSTLVSNYEGKNFTAGNSHCPSCHEKMRPEELKHHVKYKLQNYRAEILHKSDLRETLF